MVGFRQCFCTAKAPHVCQHSASALQRSSLHIWRHWEHVERLGSVAAGDEAAAAAAQEEISLDVAAGAMNRFWKHALLATGEPAAMALLLLPVMLSLGAPIFRCAFLAPRFGLTFWPCSALAPPSSGVPLWPLFLA